MKTLPLDAFQQLRAGATVVEYDRHGDKVLRLPDGTLLKLFRRKRLISSAAWYPYAQRFADNCGKLAALGIPCPETITVFRVPEIARDVVHYLPLPGQTIRQILSAGLPDEQASDLRAQLGRFIAGLHHRGVYFRSLHLGNIVQTPAGALGLIDIADLVVRRRPLSQSAIRRNMQHLLRYPADVAWLSAGQGFPLP